jgi:hypothetical protein
MAEEYLPPLPMDGALCVHDVILQGQERRPGEWRVGFDLVGHTSQGDAHPDGIEGVKLVMSRDAFLHFARVVNEVRDELDPIMYPKDDPN